MVEHRSRRALRMPLGIPAVWLPRVSIVFENVAQLFFQLSLGEYVLDTTPRRFAALAYGCGLGPPLRSLEQRVEVMGFFGFAKKLIIDIEMLVCAFAHCSRKALEINRIDQPGA
jgi:hypothetical protein